MDFLYVFNLILLLFFNEINYVDLENDSIYSSFFTFEHDPLLCIFERNSYELIQHGTNYLRYNVSDELGQISIMITFFNGEPFHANIFMLNYDEENDKIVNFLVEYGFNYRYEIEANEISKVEKYFFNQSKINIILTNNEWVNPDFINNSPFFSMINMSVINSDNSTLFLFRCIEEDILRRIYPELSTY